MLERIRSWSDNELIGKHATFTGTQVSTPGNPVTITTQVGGDGYTTGRPTSPSTSRTTWSPR